MNRVSEEKFIKIKVEVTSWFKKYTKNLTALSFELEKGVNVAGVLKNIEIPIGEVGSVMLEKEGSGEKIRIDEAYILEEGDRILLIPHILGG